MNNFTCPRTCPMANERWCRFRPILDRIGPVNVSSHTVKVKVELTDEPGLKAAVLAMGGKWLGRGTHKLYDGQSSTGMAFTLPGWKYPLIAGETLAFDDYHGEWGNVADVEVLKGHYAMACAEQSATTLGWLCERNAAGLTIHHPSGGTMTVSPAGTVDTTNFVGSGCHDARMELGLERFGLVAGEETHKAEFSQAIAAVQVGG